MRWRRRAPAPVAPDDSLALLAMVARDVASIRVVLGGIAGMVGTVETHAGAALAMMGGRDRRCEVHPEQEFTGRGDCPECVRIRYQ